MEACEQTRFDALYAQHLRALKLQGKAEATVDGYARAVRRVAAYFDRCPDQLTTEDFKNYFAYLIDTRSWSLVRIAQWQGPQGSFWLRCCPAFWLVSCVPRFVQGR